MDALSVDETEAYCLYQQQGHTLPLISNSTGHSTEQIQGTQTNSAGSYQLEMVLSCGMKGHELSLDRLMRPTENKEEMILDALLTIQEDLGCTEETLYVWPPATLLVKLCTSSSCNFFGPPPPKFFVNLLPSLLDVAFAPVSKLQCYLLL